MLRWIDTTLFRYLKYIRNNTHARNHVRMHARTHSLGPPSGLRKEVSENNRFLKALLCNRNLIYTNILSTSPPPAPTTIEDGSANAATTVEFFA